MDINVDDKDKEKVQDLSSGKKSWYAFREVALGKADKLADKDVLKAILLVLTKIYWEIRKRDYV